MGKVTNVSSKEQLLANANTLKTNVESLQTKFSSLKSTLSSVPSYDEFDLAGAAAVLCSSIDSISQNMSNISLNISNYVQDLIEFDVYDLSIDEEVNGTPSDKGGTLAGVPTTYDGEETEQVDTVGNPIGGNPTGGNPTGGNPTGGNPTGGNPTGGNPTGGNPTGGNPTGGNPTGGNPTGGNPTGGNPTGGNPTGGNPTGGNPTGGNPTGGNPTGGNPTGGNDNGTSGSENITNVPVNNSSNTSTTNESSVGTILENTTSNNVDNTVNDGYVIGGDIVDDSYDMNSDFFNDMDFDDSSVSTPVTDIDTSTNPLDSTTIIDNTSNKDSIVPEILTGLGIAAGAGATVYGGAKAVKKMKENQEFDDEE